MDNEIAKIGDYITLQREQSFLCVDLVTLYGKRLIMIIRHLQIDVYGNYVKDYHTLNKKWRQQCKEENL
jgi:uncharacterized protein YeaC (DUF1315 family)